MLFWYPKILLIGWLIDFNDISIYLGLFYA